MWRYVDGVSPSAFNQIFSRRHNVINQDASYMFYEAEAFNGASAIGRSRASRTCSQHQPSTRTSTGVIESQACEDVAGVYNEMVTWATYIENDSSNVGFSGCKYVQSSGTRLAGLDAAAKFSSLRTRLVRG